MTHFLQPWYLLKKVDVFDFSMSVPLLMLLLLAFGYIMHFRKRQRQVKTYHVQPPIHLATETDHIKFKDFP